MKSNYTELLKSHLTPFLKKSGFKKVGSNYFRDSDEVLQVFHFQYSKSSTPDTYIFFINCGIIIKSIAGAESPTDKALSDIKLRIGEIANGFGKDGIKLTGPESIEPVANQIIRAFEKEVLRLFNQLTTVGDCIEFMVSHNGLYRNEELIAYLCKHDELFLLETYIRNVQRVLEESDGLDRIPFFMDKFRSQIESLGKLTPEIEAALNDNAAGSND